MSAGAPLLVVEDLKKYYPVRGGVFAAKVGDVHAVEGVTFTVAAGETLGLVGESGCGKSTLGRTIMRLEEPTSGRVLFEGKDVAYASKTELFQIRRDIQAIFQDPYSSLNPRMTVGEIVRESLEVHGMGTKAEQIEKVRALLETVGLTGEMLDRYPHEFSGGQRQRVGVARALALDPKLVIADEPVSALDVSVRSQILNLMVRLQKERNLAYIFISHDLSVVEHISDSIAIMYLGRIVEIGPADEVFANPSHPYTRVLIGAIPVADPTRKRSSEPLPGEAPSPISPPPGCPFHPRCSFAIDACRAAVPPLEPAPTNAGGARPHLAACIRKHEI